MTDQEKRLEEVLGSSNGAKKLEAIIEQVLYNNVPPIVMSVKSKGDIYTECLGAAIQIVQEELQKGKVDLYDRLRRRVDNYWKEEPMS